MTRFLTVGAAQMGAIQRSHTRRDVVERLIAHLREARRMGCELVVFPELTLTTFFPRWWMTDQAEIDRYFERDMPNANIHSYPDALWWAVTTITTVGYGDRFPMSPEGRGSGTDGGRHRHLRDHHRLDRRLLRGAEGRRGSS